MRKTEYWCNVCVNCLAHEVPLCGILYTNNSIFTGLFVLAELAALQRMA